MNVRVARNSDGTITVRVGRAVEHIATEGKDKAQVYDAVKWAAISKGASLSDDLLTAVLFRSTDETARRSS